MAEEKFSAKEAAIQLGTDARTLRKFIRSAPKGLSIDPVGQGNRYEFTAKDIKSMKKAFTAWGGKKVETPKDEAPPKKKGKKSKDKIDESIQEQDEVDRTTEEVDLDDDDMPVDLSDLDPSDDDLEDIELEEVDL